MTITFKDVGRDKKAWTSEVESLSDRTLEREIRKHGALISRGVEFHFNEDGASGFVIVGGFRRVGSFEVDGGFRVG